MVRLTDLHADDVQEWFARMWAAFRIGAPGGSTEDKARVVAEMLAWLWRAAVQPVLAHLGLDDPMSASLSDDELSLRRVWWVPTGLLVGFPLHAAGLANGPSALNRVVSSYAPTLHALDALLRRPQGSETKILVASVPEISSSEGRPRLPRLDGVDVEARNLASLGLPTRVLRGAEATVSAVSRELKEATWAHFACHGVNVPAQPSRSSLLLYDGMLDVLGLARLGLDAAELAYLSACSTAAGGIAQVDEMVTLVSACQLAGFRHVIGTLWPVNDRSAVSMASEFYGEGLPDAATLRLHRAVGRLRRAHPDHPEYWALFIHSGP